MIDPKVEHWATAEEVLKKLDENAVKEEARIRLDERNRLREGAEEKVKKAYDEWDKWMEDVGYPYPWNDTQDNLAKRIVSAIFGEEK